MKSNYDKWDCRETVWNRVFMARAVGGKGWPIDRLNRVFFAPAHVGQTFGVGQIGPVVALSVTDLVHRKSGLPLLSIDDAPQVFAQIMNPDTSMKTSPLRSAYRSTLTGGSPASTSRRSPAPIATLYNLGDFATRAHRPQGGGTTHAPSKGLPPQWPQENFYGWFINEKAAELRKLVAGTLDTASVR